MMQTGFGYKYIDSQLTQTFYFLSQVQLKYI